MTDPRSETAQNEVHWIDRRKANEQIDRVWVRYYRVPSIFPLWDDRADVPLLKELSVARATGGTVFHVTLDQWNILMDLIGGWPGGTPEISSAEHVIAEYAGKRRSGQG